MNLPKDSIDIFISSITDSTLKQYNSIWKRWWQFCMGKNQNPFNDSIILIVEFLTFLYQQDASFSVINTARSALALIIPKEIGNDPRIRRFCKGIFNLRPSAPKYQTTWSPAAVLTYLSSCFPNNEISLESLSYKCITLLALTTAHRMQTFSLIDLDNIDQDHESVEIKIPDRIKTTRKGAFQPNLILPFFNDNPEVCAASALLCYIDRTKELRKDNKKLFISFKKPHKSVSTQTLSRWVKIVLKNSGIDTAKFSAHSTRHAAVSAANRKGVQLDVIRNSAGWSRSSEVFARFYNRPLSNKNTFANAVFNLNH